MRSEVRELRRSTQRDALTGVGSRGHTEGRLRAVVAEFQGREPAAGLLFGDVDHFKSFNDSYGHDVGDRVLRMVASTLRDNVRGDDVVGRWGGEEFVVLVYETSSEADVVALGEKLRALVEASRLDLPEESVTVTISLGATLLQARRLAREPGAPGGPADVSQQGSRKEPRHGRLRRRLARASISRPSGDRRRAHLVGGEVEKRTKGALSVRESRRQRRGRHETG